MSERLQRIEEELTKTKASPAIGSVESLFDEPVIHSTASDSIPDADESSALRQSMGRLSELVTDVECTMESGDAMDIINDLDTLLRTAAKWNRDIESTSHVYAAQQRKPGLDINELRGHLLRARTVRLNNTRTCRKSVGRRLT
jgi:hypothetical protein